jgi:hypothetical protein
LLTAPTGYTWALRARCAWRMTNSAAPWVSRAGRVLGMQATEVMPPARAAAAPVAIVSSSSLPGSRRWTCTSIRPGQTIRPRASMTISASSYPSPTGNTRPRLSQRSPIRSRSWLGSMIRPPVIWIVRTGGLLRARGFAARSCG